MSRRNQIRTLLAVREAREQVARGELSRQLMARDAAVVGLEDARVQLSRTSLPGSAAPEAFLAAVATRRAQVQQVYALRDYLAAAEQNVVTANAHWQAADQSRAATLKLVDRDRRERDEERERFESRERDDRRVVRLGSRKPLALVAEFGLGL
jgi:fructoselysine-6-P-deglycase FrlB-like protein